MIVVAILVSCVLIDYLYVRYIQAVRDHRVLESVVYSGILTSLGLFTLWWGLNDFEMIPFVVIGHMAGCYLAMTWGNPTP